MLGQCPEDRFNDRVPAQEVTGGHAPCWDTGQLDSSFAGARPQYLDLDGVHFFRVTGSLRTI